MRKNDDLTAWRMLMRVIETGSISKTADEWQTEPSSISRRISALEKSVGTQLLIRSTRQLNTTAAGQRAYEQIRPLVEQLDIISHELTQESGVLSGKIRFSAPVAMGEFLIVDWLAEFAELHPLVDIEMDLVNQSIDLLGTASDFALRIGNIADDKVIATPLGFAPSVACASPAYIARYGAPLHPLDLAQHRVVLYTPLAARGTVSMSQGTEKLDVPYHGVLKINNLTALSQAAKAGMGIHLLAPLFQCHADLKSGQLVQILADWQFASAPVHIVRLPQKNTAKRVLALIAFMKQKWQETNGFI